MKRLLAACILSLGLATAGAACAQPPHVTGRAPLTVKRVIDGDTVDLSTGQRVRLIGIDTPETGTGSCATRATARLRALVLNQAVRVVGGARDNADRYGRLLRYVDTSKYDAGRVLINEGLAIARYDSRDGYGRHTREAAYVAADRASRNCVNTTTPPSGAGIDPRFPTCTAAKQQGYGPYRRGVDTEYSWYTDGDSDGIVCE